MTYTDNLKKHYETYFNTKGVKCNWLSGPINRLHPDFYILEIAPNEIHNMWIYLTVGMSLDRNDENLIELFVFSPEQNDALVELLTIITSYHRNTKPINLNHTVNIGQAWLNDSKCDYGYISIPYLDGEELELFTYNDKSIHTYWLIPITKKERDYKMEYGTGALEDLFEKRQLDYLDPGRKSLVGG